MKCFKVVLYFPQILMDSSQSDSVLDVPIFPESACIVASVWGCALNQEAESLTGSQTNLKSE